MKSFREIPGKLVQPRLYNRGEVGSGGGARLVKVFITFGSLILPCLLQYEALGVFGDNGECGVIVHR